VDLIYNDAPDSIPAAYTLPPNLAIELESVTAEWDGSAASGSFLACLAVYSQDGKLIGRWFPSQTFASGDTGEVSYGPLAVAASAATPTTSSSLPSALGIGFQRSQTTVGGILDILFDEVAWNDASFGYSTVTSSRAQFVTITTEGWYLVKTYVSWNTDFGAFDFPFIVPTCLVLGSTDTLVNDAVLFWDDTGGIIYGEQFSAAEAKHHQIAATVLFNFTAADFGASTIGLGVRLQSAAGITKNFGGGIAVTKLGDTLTDQTIV
jgi:hypothetical protein